MLKRLAIVAGVLLFLGAVGATFLPTSPQGATCGTWFNPEWDQETTDQLAEDFEDLAERDFTGEIAPEARARSIGVQAVQRVCDDALSTRRTITFVLLAGAVIVPAAVLFVGAGRKESDSNVGGRA